MLHFEQRQLFAILKVLQEFQINWFEVLYIQQNAGALQLLFTHVHGCSPLQESLRIQAAWSAQIMLEQLSLKLEDHQTIHKRTSHTDCYCRFLTFRVHTLATKLKLCYVCSKGNRSHKNQKFYCSTCNSNDRIGSGEMEVCKALHFTSPCLEAACHYHMQHSSQDERVQRDVKSCHSIWIMKGFTPKFT